MTARISDVLISRDGDEVGTVSQTFTGTESDVREQVEVMLPRYSRNAEVQYDDGLAAAA